MRVVRVTDLIRLYNLKPEPAPELANLLIGLRVLPKGYDLSGDPDPYMISGIISDEVVLIQRITRDGRTSPQDTRTGGAENWQVDPRSLVGRLRLIYAVGRLLYTGFDVEIAGYCWWQPCDVPPAWDTAHSLFQCLPALPLDVAIDVLALLVRGMLGLEPLTESYAVPLVMPVVPVDQHVVRCRYCRATATQPHRDDCPLAVS